MIAGFELKRQVRSLPRSNTSSYPGLARDPRPHPRPRRLPLHTRRPGRALHGYRAPRGSITWTAAATCSRSPTTSWPRPAASIVRAVRPHRLPQEIT